MKLKYYLALLFQAVVSLIFITTVLFYGGIIVLVPLAILLYSIKIVALLAPTVLAVVAGIGILGYLGLQVYKMPELTEALLGVASDLIAFGNKQKDRFSPIIEASKGNAA